MIKEIIAKDRGIRMNVKYLLKAIAKTILIFVAYCLGSMAFMALLMFMAWLLCPGFDLRETQIYNEILHFDIQSEITAITSDTTGRFFILLMAVLFIFLVWLFYNLQDDEDDKTETADMKTIDAIKSPNKEGIYTIEIRSPFSAGQNNENV